MHRIKGWFSETDARLLAFIGAWQQTNSIRGDICEIGVYQGRCLVLLGLLLRPGETVFGVDLFGRDLGDEDITRANLARFCNDADSRLISKNSLELTMADLRSTGRPTGAGVRLFCIDGGHTRDIAAHDFRFAETALANGGVIVVDDFFNRNWPGVCEGINRVFFAGETKLKPFAIGQAKVLFAEAAFADRYRAAIKCDWPQPVGAAELFGSPVAVVQPQTSVLYRLRTRPVVRAIYRFVAPSWLTRFVPLALIGRHLGADEALPRLIDSAFYII
jgi:hypothetical protein